MLKVFIFYKSKNIAVVVGSYLSSFIPMNVVKIAAASLLSPLYIALYLAVLGVLIYLFGVKFAYFGQVCDIALPKEEAFADSSN